MRRIRTDLAMEAYDAAGGGQLSGIEREQSRFEDLDITRVKVTTDEGERILGRPRGNYVTVEAPNLKKDASELFERACNAVASELKEMLKLEADDTVLVVGLGNRQITPDALGPKTLDSTMITRHLVHYMPEHFKGQFRPVAGIAPGVLGVTGIETGDIVKGVVENLKPKAVVVIDALASRSLARLATTFQLSDSGISPGSGVGNTRAEISSKTLGIPVIAIGVPTVVDAATLACDVMDMVKGINPGNDSDDGEYARIVKALGPFEANLLVTPREVDELIANAAKIIGYSINRALQYDLSSEDITSFLS